MAFTKNASAQPSDNKIPKAMISRVVVRLDVGFNNNIFIRGNGAGLSWDKGIILQNRGPDIWVWETDQLFISCEFKTLINDSLYELGEDHRLTYGDIFEYTPQFPMALIAH